MAAALEDRAFVKPGVLCRELGDEAVLLDLESETYFGLNETGTRLWALVTTSPSIGSAIAAMLDEFDVDRESLERDAMTLLDELAGRGLIRIGRA